VLIENPPVAVTDNLYMLGSAEYPVYLFKGDREGAIFEGGIGAVGPLVEEQIRRLGIPRELVKQVIVTHAHPDHVMAVPWFRQVFAGIRVVASERAAATLGAEKAVAFFCGVDEALTGALLGSGRIPPGSRPATLTEKRIAVDRTVKDGDTITIDGAAFQVLETPGHSECSLSFFEPVERILVVSDATGFYMPQDGSWWPNYFSGYAAYVASIERLAGLHAEIVCLSHNAVVQGAEAVAEYFGDALKATQEYHQRIVAQAKAGTPARQIAETLGAEIHAKTPVLPVGFFQKNCGLLVKMSLKHEGMEAT
jgi:glyoxylase-like metal-dependent hydrolase (beta-lactamase superfamily II)